ncbi:hypothetical protein FF38_06843 [Lucilia cuprina]|uniref:Uncharacterized protein n=1 Tax=Lucilia cuprina TaxID=7375 RepID=A0A0L0CMQ2_LUCCU|nr:hypothetical protein FF38_06843 [Lucilia cuprina]
MSYRSRNETPVYAGKMSEIDPDPFCCVFRTTKYVSRCCCRNNCAISVVWLRGQPSIACRPCRGGIGLEPMQSVIQQRCYYDKRLDSWSASARNKIIEAVSGSFGKYPTFSAELMPSVHSLCLYICICLFKLPDSELLLMGRMGVGLTTDL